MNIIFGAEMYASFVHKALKSIGHQIDFCFVDEDYNSGKKDYDLPPISSNREILINSRVFNGTVMENKKGSSLLRRIYTLSGTIPFQMPGFCLSIDNPSCLLGNGVQIFRSVLFDENCSFGNLVQIRNGALIAHDVVIGDFSYLAPGVKVGSHCNIGEGVFIGFGSCIAPGSTIGSNSVIGSGAFVKGTVKPNSLVSPPKPRTMQVEDPFLFI